MAFVHVFFVVLLKIERVSGVSRVVNGILKQKRAISWVVIAFSACGGAKKWIGMVSFGVIPIVIASFKYSVYFSLLQQVVTVTL